LSVYPITSNGHGIIDLYHGILWFDFVPRVLCTTVSLGRDRQQKAMSSNICTLSQGNWTSSACIGWRESRLEASRMDWFDDLGIAGHKPN